MHMFSTHLPLTWSKINRAATDFQRTCINRNGKRNQAVWGTIEREVKPGRHPQLNWTFLPWTWQKQKSLHPSSGASNPIFQYCSWQVPMGMSPCRLRWYLNVISYCNVQPFFKPTTYFFPSSNRACYCMWNLHNKKEVLNPVHVGPERKPVKWDKMTTWNWTSWHPSWPLEIPRMSCPWFIGSKPSLPRRHL